MNWGRIKTILIILFLFTDIFLAFSIFIANKKETEISPEVIDATVQILQSHSISVDKSVISVKSPSAPILQADNVISEYAGFAKKILGDDYFSHDGHTYHTKDASITFFGDKFQFENHADSNASENFIQSDAQKYAISWLKALGFDISSAKVSVISFDNGICHMQISDYYENMPIFCSELDISVSKDGITSLSGSWFNQTDSGQYNLLKSTASVLVDFSASMNDNKSVTISSAEFGYNVFDSETFHKSAALIPVSKIVLNSGDEYFIDARTSE